MKIYTIRMFLTFAKTIWYKNINYCSQNYQKVETMLLKKRKLMFCKNICILHLNKYLKIAKKVAFFVFYVFWASRNSNSKLCFFTKYVYLIAEKIKIQQKSENSTFLRFFCWFFQCSDTIKVFWKNKTLHTLTEKMSFCNF